MNDELQKNGDEPECTCGCGDGECECDEEGFEVIELIDDDGEKEEFAVLEELDFEGRHFVIMAPLAEVEAFDDSTVDSDLDLSIEIFETDGEDFNILEDEELAKRLMRHLDKIAQDS